MAIDMLFTPFFHIFFVPSDQTCQVIDLTFQYRIRILIGFHLISPLFAE